jgi:RHS repeat-associated protein
LAAYNPGTAGVCQTATAAGSRTWTYDTADRLTSAGTTTTTKSNHYTSDDDRPEWTDEGGGPWTRTVAGVGRLAAVTSTFGVTDTDWQLTDLHGDVAATVHNTDVGLSTVNGSTEFGTQRNASDTGSRRYGWLGAEQRAADIPPGVVLMGVRLYLPTIGRFLSVDPVYGGSCGAYDYTCADPRNNSDLDGKENRPARRWGWPDWREPMKKIVRPIVNRVTGIWRAANRITFRGAMWAIGKAVNYVVDRGPWTWRSVPKRLMFAGICAGQAGMRSGRVTPWNIAWGMYKGFMNQHCD